jgi:thymidylate synthase
MREILNEGDYKEPARENLPGTKELFVRQIRHDLQKGFPLLTTRELYIKGGFEELIWFLTGSTDVGELIHRGCNFWNEDTYKFNKKKYEERYDNYVDYEVWLESIKDGTTIHTDAGELYGKLWRKFNGDTDQICNLVNRILKEPNSRYSVVSAWHPSVVARGYSALPSCHMIWQTNVRERKYLDLVMMQRSCDFPIGVPFNIASYALLVHLLCTILPYEPGHLIWIGNSVHIYENQIDTCHEQLSRSPRELPQLKIKRSHYQDKWDSTEITEYFKSFKFEDIEIINYNPYPRLVYPFSSGLVKK